MAMPSTVGLTLTSNLYFRTLQALRAYFDGIEGLPYPTTMRQWCHNDDNNLYASRNCYAVDLNSKCAGHVTLCYAIQYTYAQIWRPCNVNRVKTRDPGVYHVKQGVI